MSMTRRPCAHEGQQSALEHNAAARTTTSACEPYTRTHLADGQGDSSSMPDPRELCACDWASSPRPRGHVARCVCVFSRSCSFCARPQVATFLDLRDLPAFALASQRMRDAARHEFVFETLARSMGLTLVSAAASRGSRESRGDGDGSRQWFELLRHVVPSRREARLILRRFERGATRLQLRRQRAELAHRPELRRRRLRRLARLSGSTATAASSVAGADPDAEGGTVV